MAEIRETDADREIQEIVKGSIEKSTGWELVPTRTLDPYDFDAYCKQRKVALVEVRRRNNCFSKYPNYWMSYIKYKKLRLLGEAFEVPVFYVILFDDGLFYVNLMKYPLLTTTYGDRGNPDRPRFTDNELVVEIKQEYFIRPKVQPKLNGNIK